MMESTEIRAPEIIYPHSLITRRASFFSESKDHSLLIGIELINKNTLTTIIRTEIKITQKLLTEEIAETKFSQAQTSSIEQTDFKKLLQDLFNLGYILTDSSNINKGFFINKEELI